MSSGFFRGRRPQRRDERVPSARINERIRVPEIRVVDEEGKQLGIMRPQDALQLARERGLDLVEVAPQAQPPVCRIINFGKYQYELKKKQHDAKKKQTTIVVKEIKFRPATDEHDYDFKKNNAIRMLQDGDKVKATVTFRGREITHKELGFQLLSKLEIDLAEVSLVEVRPKLEGMNMFAIFTPKKVEKGPKKPSGEPKHESKTEPKHEAKTEAKAEAKPEIKAEATPEPKPE